MALPAGVARLGSFKGAKGDTGSLAFATAEKVAWTEDPDVEMVGPESARGAHFRIPMPLPGPETVNNDDATELLILNPTKTSAALTARIGETITEPGPVRDAVDDLIVNTVDASGVRVGARGGLRVVPWGDSTSAANSVRYPATSWGNRDFWAWGHVLSGGAFQYVQNGAVAGDDSGEAIPRFAADIAAWQPNVVPIQFGINDAVTGIAPVTFIANIKQMIALVRSIGATPWLCTVSGNLNAPTTPPVRNFIAAYNQRIRALAAAEGLPVLDIARIMTNPLDGAIPAAYDLDGTHQNAAGARAIGQAIAALVAANLPEWSPPLPAASNDPWNLVANGLFMASGPGAGAPAGWASTGGAPSIVAPGASDHGRWARLADATVETANIRYIRPGSPPTGLAAGDVVQFVGRLRVVNGTSVATTRLMMILTGSAGSQVSYVLGDITADVDGAFCISARVPAGYSAVQWQLARIVTSAGNGYAEIAQLGCYNATALGIA